MTIHAGGRSFCHRSGPIGSIPAPTPAPSAPISAVADDGWSATYAGALPTTTLGAPIEQDFTVMRQGFANGVATSFPETIRVTTPKRAAGTLLHDTGKVALSSYVMAVDLVQGATIGSLLVSPAPVANCFTYDRMTITDTIGGASCPVEVFADHWSGIDCVKFIIAKAAATPIVVTVSARTISTSGSALKQWDRTPFPVFSLPATDVSSLTGDGQVKVDYEVYPKVGVAASVLKSADNTTAGMTRREATTRYYDKRARGYVYAIVGPTGTDGTGVIGTRAAAGANKFLTPKGALDAITAAAATNGVVDGVRIQFDPGTYTLANPAAGLVQNTGALIIERNPDTSTAATDVVLQTTGAFRPRIASGLVAPLTRSCVVTRDITLGRTVAGGVWAGEGTSFGNVPLLVVTDNCRVDYGAGFNANFFSTTVSTSSNVCFQAHYGSAFPNFTATGMSGTGVNETQMLRGIDIAPTVSASFSLFNTVTSRFTGVVSTFAQADYTKGFIYFGNEVRSSTANAIIKAFAPDGQTMGGVVLAQSIFEPTTATSGMQTIGIADDTGSTSHTLVYGNSGAGWGGTGRWNFGYDRFVAGATVRQPHPFMLFQGNIVPQFNTKGDKWKLNQGAATPEIYDGNLALDHGVLCEGNVMVFNSDNAGASGTVAGRTWQGTENQTYPGRNTFRNAVASNSHYLQDPAVEWEDIYTTYGGTGDNGAGTRVAGPGGTVFTLEAASPAKNRLAVPRLAKDFGGNARPTPDSAGAFA